MVAVVTKETIEHRTLEAASFEIRANEDGSKTLEGYAIKWDQLSVPLGWFTKFREKFKKGAFRDYLDSSESDCKFLIGHDMNQVLGRRKNNTLELKEDDTGLWFKLDLPNTTQGNDAFESVKRRDVDGISVGFKMLAEEWDESDEANIIRTVTKANLPEISLTAWPAYESTSVSARSIEDAYNEFKEQQNPSDKQASMSMRGRMLELLEKQ